MQDLDEKQIVRILAKERERFVCLDDTRDLDSMVVPIGGRRYYVLAVCAGTEAGLMGSWYRRLMVWRGMGRNEDAAIVEQMLKIIAAYREYEALVLVAFQTAEHSFTLLVDVQSENVLTVLKGLPYG